MATLTYRANRAPRGLLALRKIGAVVGTVIGLGFVYPLWLLLSFAFRPRRSAGANAEGFEQPYLEEGPPEEILTAAVRERRWARNLIKTFAFTLLFSILPPFGISAVMATHNPGPPDEVTLSPTGVENEAGTPHTVTATVSNVTGTVEGAVVTFTAAGTDFEDPPGPVTATTNHDGLATFTFTSTKTGSSVVTATIDDTATTSTATATKEWTPADLDHFRVEAVTPQFVGDCFVVSVTAEDVHGNTTTNTAEGPALSVGTLDSASDDGTSDLRFHGGDDTCATVGTPQESLDMSGDGFATTTARDTDVETVTITAEQTTPAGNKSGSTQVEIIPTSTMTITPTAETNIAGSPHTVTVTVTNTKTNTPLPGVTVTITTDGTGFEDPSGTVTVTNADGQVTFTFTSTKTGTTTITATSTVAGTTHVVTATKTWIAGDATTVTVTPTGVTNTVGETHTVTATAVDENGNPAPGTTVTFTAAGTEFEDPSGTVTFTDDNGVATFTFTSTKTGTSTVTATAPSGAFGTATKIWEPDEPVDVILRPESATNTVGDLHVVTAEVVDRFGNRTDTGPRGVVFSATGTGAEDPSILVTETTDGVATYTFTSTKTGTSTILVLVDDEEGGFFEDTATKTWVASAAFQVTLTPETATNTVGETHTVTALVTDEHGNRVEDGTEVDFCIGDCDYQSGDSTGSEDPSSGVATTTNGVATFSFTSIESGRSDIVAVADPTGDGGFGFFITCFFFTTCPHDFATKTWVASTPTTVTLSPEFETNTVGDIHVVTAHVVDEFDNDVSGTVVTFTAGGTSGEDPAFATATTDVSGTATFTFTSTRTGTSTVTGTVSGGAFDTATKVWEPDEAVDVILEPETAKNLIGTTHTVTATIVDRFGNRVDTDHDTVFTATGTGDEHPSAKFTVAEEGLATYSFSSDITGTSDILVEVDLDGTGTGGGNLALDRATKIWHQAASTITLEPLEDENFVGDDHTVTATVSDPDGVGVPGVVVTFTVAGTGGEDPVFATATTNFDGQATFTFTSTQAGDSRIVASFGTSSVLTNAGFETGDTTGWSTGGSVGVTGSHTGGTDSYDPVFGSFFLVLEGGSEDVDAFASQTVPLAAGEEIGGFAAFDSHDSGNGGGFDDDASVQIFKDGVLVATPWFEHVVGLGGAVSGPWTPWSFTPTETADYTIVYRTANRGDSLFNSHALFDGPEGTSAAATKTWVRGAAQTITVTPTAATNTVGTTHTFTVTATDRFGNPADDDTVTMTVTGPGETETTQTTNAEGVATFSFSSTQAGTSLVTFTIGTATATATKTWVHATATTVTVTPIDATNTVGTVHTITARAVDRFENPVGPGDTATMTVSGVGATETTQATDADGRVTFTFSSTQAGTSLITVTVGTATATATKTWVTSAAHAVVIEPEEATNTVGDPHTVTATVVDEFGNHVHEPFIFHFEAAGTGSEDPDEDDVFGPDGNATFTFTATRTGTSIVTVAVDTSEGTLFATATKHWVPGPGASALITPTSATNTVGETHTVTVKVFDRFGNEVGADEPVTFTVGGTGGEDPVSATATTDSEGRATFTFTSTRTGRTVITVTMEDGTSNATKDWVPGPPDFGLAEQDDDTNEIGEDHTVSAAFVDEFGNAVADGTVITFTVTGEAATVVTRTTTDGVAMFTFTANRTGVSIITASAEGETQTVVSNNLTKEWVCGPGPSHSFFAFDMTFRGGVFVAGGDLNDDGCDELIVGAGPGGGPHVKVFDGSTGDLLASFFAYAATFRGGVRVGAGDINGDGIDDLITGAGPGGGPHVKVFDGPSNTLIRSFFAFDATFRGGVFVAGGDINGSGPDDVIVGAGESGGPHVKVFSGGTTLIRSFFAYDATFRGGVRVGAGNINGSGPDDLITGAGPGGGPHVQVFSGGTTLIRSFFAYPPLFDGGVYVAGGDINGSGPDDLITGAGPGGGPHVKAFSGGTSLIRSFFAYDAAFRSGVHVGAGDLNGDGDLEILTGAGRGGGPHVKVFD